MTIGIDPVFHLGTFEVRWITLIVTLAAIVGIMVMALDYRLRGLPWRARQPGEMILAFLLGCTIGGTLFNAIIYWRLLLIHPMEILGSLSLPLHGVVLGGIAAILIYYRLERLPIWQYVDIIAPAATLGLALARIGCFINGCCYGLPTDLPWAVTYTNPGSAAPLSIPLHPAQLYYLLLGIMVFVILWSLRKKMQPAGSLFLLWLALFAATDLPLRFLRFEHAYLQLSVILDVLIMMVTVPWLIRRIYSVKSSYSYNTID